VCVVCVCVCGRFEIDEWRGLVTVAVDADADNSLLDAERTDHVDVLVISTTDSRCGAAVLVRVQLADLNDNRPMFTQTSYTADIAENSLSFSTPVSVTV